MTHTASQKLTKCRNKLNDVIEENKELKTRMTTVTNEKNNLQLRLNQMNTNMMGLNREISRFARLTYKGSKISKSRKKRSKRKSKGRKRR
jgi:predicted nuclease with TOPRIM domain